MAAASSFTPVYPSAANWGGGYPYFVANGAASSLIACFCAPSGSASPTTPIALATNTPSAAAPVGCSHNVLAWAPVNISGMPSPAVGYCLAKATAGGPVAHTVSAWAPEDLTWLSTALNSVVVVWNCSVATSVTP